MSEGNDIVTRLRVLNHHAKKLAENESLHDLHREAFTRCEHLTWEAADEIERLRSERDEAIIHANNVVRESSSLITAKIPCGSCGGYWNAVDNFRRFESKTI